MDYADIYIDLDKNANVSRLRIDSQLNDYIQNFEDGIMSFTDGSQIKFLENGKIVKSKEGKKI